MAEILQEPKQTNSDGVRHAYTGAADPAVAAAELAAQLGPTDGAWIVFFCSPDYDFDRLGPALGDAFPDACVMGCTSAGHHGTPGYVHGGIVASSVRSDALRARAMLIPDLANLTVDRAAEVGKALCGSVPDANTQDSFVMVLSDALAQREEVMALGLNAGLQGIRLFGGSAADEGRISSTKVYFDGRFQEDIAVAALVRTTHPFRIFKHAHFSPGKTRMVVTAARPESRTVDRINGRPAAAEYARILGLEIRENDPLQFSAYPVMVRFGAEHFMRTPMNVDPDGPIQFACAIEEGVVLTTSVPGDPVACLQETMQELHDDLGVPDLVVGCDCTGRLMELEATHVTEKISDILRASNAICFATYGEQLDSVHINQTLTGVALRLR